MTPTTTKSLTVSQSLKNKFRPFKHAFQPLLPLFPQHLILQSTLLLYFVCVGCRLHSLCSFSTSCSFINPSLPQLCLWNAHSSLNARINQLSSDSLQPDYLFCTLLCFVFVEVIPSVSRKPFKHP